MAEAIDAYLKICITYIFVHPLRKFAHNQPLGDNPDYLFTQMQAAKSKLN